MEEQQSHWMGNSLAQYNSPILQHPLTPKEANKDKYVTKPRKKSRMNQFEDGTGMGRYLGCKRSEKQEQQAGAENRAKETRSGYVLIFIFQHLIFFRRRTSCHHIECLLSLETDPKAKPRTLTTVSPCTTSNADTFPLPMMPCPCTPTNHCCKDSGTTRTHNVGCKEEPTKQREQEAIQNVKAGGLNEETGCHFRNTPVIVQINNAKEERTLLKKLPQPTTDEDEVKVIFEDIKVECINIEESEEEGDLTSGSEEEEDEEDEEELGASIEKENGTSSQEKEKPTFIKPFKKRRRMQQMYYPKSRFISITNNLIFDLTVEEEFRIHNINFRRLMEYTNFIKLMKQKFQSSWEDYKKTIFVSAFSLNKVDLQTKC